MIYTYNDSEYEVEIIRKNNKNTYLRVKDNKIIITTSYFTPTREIEKLIKNNTNFINKGLEKTNKIKDDTDLKLFGSDMTVIYGFPTTEIEDNKIYCRDEKALNKFLTKYVNDKYSERLEFYYNLFEENIPVPNLKIRKMKTRWGVCNLKNKNVTLNSELSKYNIECLNYVIVHELSHFIHPNHSKSFWNLVSKYYPNYKEIRKSLRN